MKNRKIILIIGSEKSGKTILSKTMMLAFQKPHFINGRTYKIRRFFFDGLTEQNDVLVIDDVSKKVILELVFCLWDEILVNTKHKSPKKIIIPNIIINGNFEPSELKQFGAGFIRRVKILKTEFGASSDMNLNGQIALTIKELKSL